MSQKTELTQQQAEVHHQLEIYGVEIHSPLPPPQMLAEYEKVMPGIAAKWVEQWVREAESRRSLESRDMGIRESESIQDHRQQMTGMIMAFVMCLTAMGLSAFFFATSNNAAGIGASSVALLVAVISLCGTFLKAKRPEDPPKDSQNNP